MTKDFWLGAAMTVFLFVVFVVCAEVGFERQDRALEREREEACQNLGREC